MERKKKMHSTNQNASQEVGQIRDPPKAKTKGSGSGRRKGHFEKKQKSKSSKMQFYLRIYVNIICNGFMIF